MSTALVPERNRVQARPISVQAAGGGRPPAADRRECRSEGRLRVGDRLAVQRVSQDIKDPATGKVIRRMSTGMGVIRVVDADEQSAVAEIVSGSGFKVSDAVRSVDGK